MYAKMSTRRIHEAWARLTKRFSPAALVPDRSSPSSQIVGSPAPGAQALKALPRAWTTPLLPSVNSYRQPRSRSTPAERRKKPPPWGCAFQFRFTLSRPPVVPCLVRETDGAALVRVTLDSETPPLSPATGLGRLV